MSTPLVPYRMIGQATAHASLLLRRQQMTERKARRETKPAVVSLAVKATKDMVWGIQISDDFDAVCTIFWAALPAIKDGETVYRLLRNASVTCGKNSFFGLQAPRKLV